MVFDTGKAEVGGRVLPSLVVLVDGAGGEFDGAGGEFDGAGGEFDGAGGEFDVAAATAGAGQLIVVLPVSFQLAVAASMASAALISEFWEFLAGISEFVADGGGPDFTDPMFIFFPFDTPNPKSKSVVRKHWLRPVQLRPLSPRRRVLVRASLIYFDRSVVRTPPRWSRGWLSRAQHCQQFT
jgi:hypothetical protein